MNKRRYLIIAGIVVAAVVAVILLDTMLANHRPAIAGLEAPERVVPRGKCQIVCNASDRDGDQLSYYWLTSGGDISGTGAAVNWTAPDSVGSYNITVAVTDGRSQQVTREVTIEVRANRAPIIGSLVADANWTLPLGSLRLTCTASDPDGDILLYEWTAAAGDISGTGEVVNWTAPQELGIHNVTVVVRDGHGSSAARMLALSVSTGQPPTIQALNITKDRYGHCYLKKSGDEYLVGKEQKYDIECILANPSSGVSYNWSCDGGDISGWGSMITWTAPNPAGSVDVTVRVIVSDATGNLASKDLVLNVVNCSKCTFGC